MKILGVIPARYASTRFPGKPLAILNNKYVIQHVVERVSKVIDNVYVATDDNRIKTAVESFGGNAIMTRSDHKSGTDRVAEVVNKLNKEYDIIINIQGDEPFIAESQIRTLIDCFKDNNTQIATLGKPFDSLTAAKNPNSPKIILDNNNFAMLFTRSLVPFIRNKEEKDWINSYPFLKHIGIYAYRLNVLKEITSLPQTTLELAESLEQLRWLQYGYKIKVALTNIETIGIDTPNDLIKAESVIDNDSSM